MNRIITLIVLLVSSITTIKAQTVTIYRSGLPLSPSYSTVDSALKASLAGDSLVLSAHTFLEHDLVINKNLVLKGTLAFPDSTRIDANALGRVINISNSSKVTLRDITIMRGSTVPLIALGDPGWGGGIQAASGSTLTLAGHTVVRDNSSGGSPTYLSGGGINGHIVVLNDNAVIRNNSGGLGGGVSAGTLTMSGNTIVTGNIGGGGAGVYCGTCNIAGNALISNNTAQRGGDGGGVMGSIIIMSGNAKVTGNKMINPLYSGGGIACTNSLQLSGAVKVMDNNSATVAGGIYLGDEFSTPAICTIKDSVIIADNAAIGYGGAVYSNNSSIIMTGGQLIGNQAASGSAIFNDRGIVTIKNTRIYNPAKSGARQNEVYTVSTGGGKFETESCWWGDSDTTGLIINEPGTTVIFTSRVVANWTLNGGLPIGSATTYPVMAHFTLQDSTLLPGSSFTMLKGSFSATSGSFSPAIANIDAMNAITSLYTIPGTGTSPMLCVVDADTFKALSTGVGIHDLSPANAIKVYPNPFENHFYVDLPASWLTGTVAIHITDMYGRTVSDIVSPAEKINERIQEISGGLQSGYFIMSLRNTNTGFKQVFKVSKQ